MVLVKDNEIIIHVNVNAPRFCVVYELASRMFGAERGGEERGILVFKFFLDYGIYYMGICHFVYFSPPIFSWSWSCRCGLQCKFAGMMQAQQSPLLLLLDFCLMKLSVVPVNCLLCDCCYADILFCGIF